MVILANSRVSLRGLMWLLLGRGVWGVYRLYLLCKCPTEDQPRALFTQKYERKNSDDEYAGDHL
jgi:hypothetical protein